MTGALATVGSEELTRLARVAERLLAGRPVLSPGHRPRRRRAGHGSEFLDFRSYRDGDDVRDIDWRASVRAREPQVRRRIEETRVDWYVCLDASASMAVDPAAWTLARQLAAAWCFLAMHLGQRAGLVLYSDRLLARLPAGSGHGHFARLSRVLEAAAADGSGHVSRPSVCAGALPARSPALVVSDCLAVDAMRAELTALYTCLGDMHLLEVRGHPCAARVDGHALLVDSETGEARPVADFETAAAKAGRRLEALARTLQDWTRAAGIPHTACTTDARWSRVLAEHLGRLVPDGA